MIRINPRGGFTVTGHQGLVSEAHVTHESHLGHDPTVRITFCGTEPRALREADQQAFLTWVLDKLGGGLVVEFNQTKLAAEGVTAGCAPTVQASAVAEHAAPAVKPEELMAQMNALVMDLVAKDLNGSEAPRNADRSSGTALEVTAIPTIADVPVVERASGTAASKKPRNSRGKTAVVEGLARSGEQQPQDQKNVATLVPASEITAPPAKPTVPESGFAVEMAEVTAQLHAERSPAEPSFRDEAVRVVPDLTPLDKLVHLLTTPPMPADLHPFDLRRRPGDTRMADTALVRLYYLRCLDAEYAASAADPNFYPVEPQEADMLVDTSTDDGVVALAQMILRIRDRAAELGLEIPQVEAFAILADERDVIRMAVERVRQRRDRQANG